MTNMSKERGIMPAIYDYDDGQTRATVTIYQNRAVVIIGSVNTVIQRSAFRIIKRQASNEESLIRLLVYHAKND